MNENKKVITWGIGFIVLLIAAVGIYYFFIRDAGEQLPAVSQVIEDTAEKIKPAELTEGPGEAEEPIQVNLDESDSLVRDLAKSLSSRPELVRWLLTDDLIRRFTASVDNIANGQSPRRHIDFFAPKGEFLALEKQEQYVIDPVSYSRYSVVGDVFSSLNARGCVKLYRRLYRVIQQAYRDLGYPDGNFHGALLQAIEELLGVPVVEGEVALERKLLSYEIAVPEWEGLSQAQKHLFRMGPRNVGIIQSKLRELKSLLLSR